LPEHWYETFFQGLALDFWRAAVTPAQTEAEADFLERALELPPGARVLDVPCGGGRHCLALAARGHRATGVDLAPEFIREAQTAAEAARAQAEFFAADMRDLPWEGEFDGAFCYGNSFGYLEHEGTRQFLAAVTRTLKPAARFVLDTGTTAESILPVLPQRRWLRAGGILFLSEARYEPAASRLDVVYTFVRGDREEQRPASYQIYTVAEVQRLLSAAGLETLALHESSAEEPFKVGSPRLLLVAQKA
jgi:SAM-dependent methyltransferase